MPAAQSNELPGSSAQASNTSLITTLPDPGLDGADPADPVATNSAAPADIPPVTITTVLRPDRIFWLFIIGLIVFTVSYGVQVLIWYRLRR
jgi:hypothetical protein